jgi:hypothetical protein
MKLNLFAQSSLVALSMLTISGCGLFTPPQNTESETLTTNQRPDIADDRRSVHVTFGSQGYANIKAADLKGLVSKVPDIDTGELRSELLTGEFIFQVAQNPRTEMVAIAVRGMMYAETDFTMLFVVNPMFPDQPELVKFVMPGQKAAADGSTAPFRAVRELRYDDSGILHLVHTDASSSKAEVLINPDLSIRSCKYLEKDEGLLCGEDH